jgi:BolA protein
VSEQFDSLSLLKQHQLINTTLKEELANGVHALAIKTMTTQKWRDQQTTGEEVAFRTPNCLGGEKKENTERS